jgi:opacity protein-like surface antigen
LTLAILCTPVQARADAFVSPWGGLVFGNDQATKGFHSIGVTFGSAGHGLVGTETTIGIAPGFFGNGVENYVLDLMAGVTVGPTFGTKTPHDTRPYGLIEGGTIRTSITGIGTGAAFARNNIGLAVGGGTTVALNDRLLVRGEVRYIKSFKSTDAANSLNANLADFHYWRTAFGLTIH